MMNARKLARFRRTCCDARAPGRPGGELASSSPPAWPQLGVAAAAGRRARRWCTCALLAGFKCLACERRKCERRQCEIG